MSGKKKSINFANTVFFINEEFNFESIKTKALEQLKSGKSLLGKDGAFAPLLESILNAALKSEMDSHLTSESLENGNRRNGHMHKQADWHCPQNCVNDNSVLIDSSYFFTFKAI